MAKGKLVRIDTETHRLLSILSALTGKPIGELVEEGVLKTYKSDLRKVKQVTEAVINAS